ncbi:MAG TPA: hypothetical protein VKT75_03310 [Acidobacteriaceae bacterium]|nr:hypothetical protein [Acidobacteriaceae bacterium]
MPVSIDLPASKADHSVVIEVGGLPIEVKTEDPAFERLLRNRYGDYVKPVKGDFSLSVTVTDVKGIDPDADTEVWLEADEWKMQRGDFRARWNPAERQGQVWQSANPYSIDAVLRIVHTLMLAQQGGFLLHASSLVRNGKAFLFSGVSGAGKTTMARLAPPDTTLLTDEASYVRKLDGRYVAYGTPFAGELAQPGKDISAPVAALYLLDKAPENRIEKMESAAALQSLLRNILFFAQQPEMVRRVFEAACEFVDAVPVFQLSFYPDQRVWDLIR